MMTTSQAVRTGLQTATRSVWMVVIFYAANLLLAAIIAAPLHKAISDHLGHSAMANDLIRGFDLGWLTEFQITNGALLEHIATLVAWTGVLFLALNTVLSAGAFQVFARPEDSKLATFGYGMGRYFFRFARLALVASVFYFLAFWLFQGLGDKLIARLSADSAYEAPWFYLHWLRWALLFASVFVINAIVEYAKGDMVLDDHRSALAALGHAAGFVFARFARVMAIYLSLGVLTTLAILLYSAFARYFPQTGVITIFVWFLVAQFLLYLRWTFRLASWAAAVAYYRSRQPQATTLPVEAQVEPV